MDLSELPVGPAVRHPWEVARARYFRELLVRERALSWGDRVLDVGAGDGYFAAELLASLPDSSSIVCWDPGYEHRQAPLLAQCTASGRMSFVVDEPDAEFDLVLLLDVIEHVQDDLGFLRHLVSRRLRPSGVVLVSVPAWPSLYGTHDRALGHHRRYRPAELREVLGAAGLRVRKSGGLFVLPAAARAASVALERARPPAAPTSPKPLAWSAGPRVTRVVDAVLRVEALASRSAADLGISLPGLSTWAICDV